MSTNSTSGPLSLARPSLGRSVLWIASIALFYFAAARLSLLFVFQPEGIAAIWPPAGIFLSAMLLTRRGLRPWLAGTIFITDFIAEMLTGTPLPVSLIYAMALTGDAVLSLYLLRRFVGEPITFGRVREVIGWLLLSVLLSNALTALVAAAASRLVEGASFWSSWRWWAASEGVGNLLVTPLILSWAAWGRTRVGGHNLKRVLEGALLFILLAILNYIAFNLLSEYGQFSLLLTYLCFPFLLWAALRFEVRGVASTSVVLAGIAIYFAAAGGITNVLLPGFPLDFVVTVQLYLAIMAVPPLFLAVVVRERRQVEAARLASERLTHDFLDSSSSLVYAVDPDGRFVLANRRLEMLLGVAPGLLNGQTRERFLPKEIADQHRQNDLQVMRNGRPIAFEEENVEQDARHLYSTVKFPLRDAHGQIFAVGGMSNDITERKRSEESLRNSEAKYRRLHESMMDAFVAVDMAGRIQESNLSYQAMLGYTDEELRQLTYQDLTPEKWHGFEARIVAEQLLHRGHSEVYEKEYRRRGGTVFPIELRTSLIRDDAGQPVAMWAIVRDITERRTAEQEVRRLNAELEQRIRDRTARLEETNKELEAFVYSVSHDLRAPLRAVDGFTQILVEDFGPRLDDEGRRVCSVISRSAQTMGKLIDDLLAFSRIGRAEIQASSVDMAALTKSTFIQLATPEERERIDFRVGPLPAAQGDPMLLRQVWMNLLGNAVKFSSKKERAVIEVGAERREDGTIYTVRDNGAGFDMQYAGKLFGVFQRLHSANEFEGTGVGLAIVQRIIHRHGGRVGGEGKVNEGAIFFFTLPKTPKEPGVIYGK